MPILSQRRQITLPKALCDRLRIELGDDLLFLEHKGRITILKKTEGSSDGSLRHLRPNSQYSAQDLLHATLEKRPAFRACRKHVT